MAAAAAALLAAKRTVAAIQAQIKQARGESRALLGDIPPDFFEDWETDITAMSGELEAVASGSELSTT